MSILVTGGAGYIGSHMVLELLEAGEQVVVLDNLQTGCRGAVPAEAVLVAGDAGAAELVRMIISEHGVEAIIHFAGSIVVPESVADPLGYYHNNTVKSHALIETAIAVGVKNFIFSSTAAVYGSPKEMPVREDADLKPLSPYGWSKLMTEIMLADCARAYGLNYVALRYFNVAGADPAGRTGQRTPRATHLIKAACETALGKRSHMEVFGMDYPTPDGTCIRDFIHVTDLVRAHRAALAHLRAAASSQILNCGYSKGYSVLQVIAAVKRASGVDFPVRPAPRRPGDAPVMIAASDKIRAVLGWVPEHNDLDRIVADALAWEQHFGR